MTDADVTGNGERVHSQTSHWMECHRLLASAPAIQTHRPLPSSLNSAPKWHNNGGGS